MSIVCATRALRIAQVCKFATYALKLSAVRNISRWWCGVSGLATALMSGRASRKRDDALSRSRSFSFSSLKARASPISIDHHFGDATSAQKRAALPHATMSLGFLYRELVRHELWNAHFDRGGNAHARPVRSLATRHLSAPASDGWNAVAGATELASAWAMTVKGMLEMTNADFGMPLDTRIRLAVCLSVAWKFERQLCSDFPRRFYDVQPSLAEPHTRELAYLGYAFMSDEERVAFGGWGEQNVHHIRKLYHDMVAMEVSLLMSVPVFTTLTRSAQVLAEARLQALFDDGSVSADESMTIRSIVPFFSAACQDGCSARPTAGALVCAAMLCVRVRVAQTSGTEAALCAVVRSLFLVFERKGARALVGSGLRLKAIPAVIVSLGCYADPSWVNYACICPETLEWALRVAEEC